MDADSESSSGHTTSSEKVTSAENLEAEGSSESSSNQEGLCFTTYSSKADNPQIQMHGVVVLHGSGWPKRVLSSFT